MPHTRLLLLLTAIALTAACRDTSAPCAASTKPALVISAIGKDNRPVGGATIVYDRHGDDTLTLLHPSLASGINIGAAPGTYNIRVIAAGYVDWLTANIVIGADGCDPHTVTMQVFMQTVP